MKKKSSAEQIVGVLKHAKTLAHFMEFRDRRVGGVAHSSHGWPIQAAFGLSGDI